MNLKLSIVIGSHARFSRCAAILLLWLTTNLLPTHAAVSSPVVVSNLPAVYVAKAEPEVTNGLGYWIWDQVTLNKQTVRLWDNFNVPKTNPVVHAELRIAADNAFKIWLDGQELGDGSDWRTLSIYHLEGKLRSGTHVLAVEGFNDNEQAGIILGLTLQMADGQLMQIRSDTNNWHIVPDADNNSWQTMQQAAADWPNASVAKNFGRVPWWTVPVSVLHIREELPKPVPIWLSRNFQIELLVGCIIFVLICIYLLIQLLSQAKAHQMVQAERDRIARDIHDDLGSKLTQLLLAGEVAQIESAPGTPLSQMCDDARNILATMDEVVWIVNSQHDNLEDFVIYACKYAQSFLEPSPIRCRFKMPQELPAKTLSELTRRNLFLAMKEALNNAVKHSQATELTVQIELNGSRLKIMTTDNGHGFDAAKISAERNGLTNMKMRLAEIGGDCHVVSQPGAGCRVIFQVPLKQPSFFKSLFRSRNQDRSSFKLAEQRDALSSSE